MRFGLGAILALTTLVAALALPNSDTVTTKYGVVKGLVNEYGRQFRGVPFATPPVGPLRWKSPQPPAPWSGVKYTQNDYPGCIQKCTGPVYMCPPTISEDCLAMNIFTPDMTDVNELLPVAFWIPGGNYLQGFGGGPVYDFRNYAKRAGIILIAVSYRVGSMGFLHTDTWSDGNYGIQDQRLALKFVHENIAAFGGNPKRVTIWGQSAGAGSVGIHVTSPASRGYFHQAMMLSNMLTIPLRNRPEAHLQADALAVALKCTVGDALCLRSKTSDEVLAAQLLVQKNSTLNKNHPLSVFMPWGPVIDTKELKKQPMDQLLAGDFAPLPMVVGSVEDEVLLFMFEGMQKPLDYVGYQIFLGLIVGFHNLDKVNKEYPPPKLTDYRAFVSVVGSDYIFHCPGRNVTRTLAKKMPLWFYTFDHPMSFGKEGWGPDFWFCANVTCHGGDLPFWFYSYPFGGFSGNSDEVKMSGHLIDYVTNFVNNGNPNKGTSVPVEWPGYNTSADKSLHFDTPVPVQQSGAYRKHCNFWDEMGYKYG